MSGAPEAGAHGRHEEVLRRHGVWTGHNIRLPDGQWTMGEGLVGAGEMRLQRITQTVLDLLGGSLEGTRVADLGCLEGMFGLELAVRGAELTAIDGREGNLEKARFAARELGLTGRFEVDDARNFGVEGYGEFDVVLCLGLLYHLGGRDALKLIESIGSACTRLAVIETQVALAPREALPGDARYHGLSVGEEETPWASIENRESFWLTRSSLLNALTAAGFATVLEARVPAVPETDAYRDHVTYVALKGSRESLVLAPQLERLSGEERLWPERMREVVHPAQRGWLARLTGRGSARTLARLFRKRTPG